MSPGLFGQVLHRYGPDGLALLAAVAGVLTVWQFADSRKVNLFAAESDLRNRVFDSETGQRSRLLATIAPTSNGIDLAFSLRATDGTRSVTRIEATLSTLKSYVLSLHPCRLCISGLPGSGKSVAITDLIIQLLEDSHLSPRPIPLRLSASGWDPRGDFDSWLCRQLRESYRVPRRNAYALVKARRILPVIDGIDEMAGVLAGRRDARLKAAFRVLNGTFVGRERLPVIITCRTDEYEHVRSDGVHLEDAVWLDIRPLTGHQVAAYGLRELTNQERAGGWRSVLSHLTLGDDDALARRLNTPWVVTLCITTARVGWDPDDLLYVQVWEELKSELLSYVVKAACIRMKVPQRVGRYETYCKRLALYLSRQQLGERHGRVCLAGSEIRIHTIWPMGGPRRVRVAHGALLAMPVALWLLTVWSVFGARPSDHAGSTLRLIVRIALTLAAGGWVIRAAQRPWPQPMPLGRGFRTRELRDRRLGMKVASLMEVGICVVVGCAVVSTAIWNGLVGWGAAVAVGLIGGAAVSLWSGLDRTMSGSSDLRAAIPREAAAAVAGSGMGWLVLHLGVGFTAERGILVGSALAVALVFVGGLNCWLRYTLALSWLHFCDPPFPWRLAEFLDWGCLAGLFRVSGVGFEFRHYDLQMWFGM